MSSLCQVYIVVCLKNMFMIFRKGNENSPKRCCVRCFQKENEVKCQIGKICKMHLKKMNMY